MNSDAAVVYGRESGARSRGEAREGMLRSERSSSLLRRGRSSCEVLESRSLRGERRSSRSKVRVERRSSGRPLRSEVQPALR